MKFFSFFLSFFSDNLGSASQHFPNDQRHPQIFAHPLQKKKEVDSNFDFKQVGYLKTGIYILKLFQNTEILKT